MKMHVLKYDFSLSSIKDKGSGKPIISLEFPMPDETFKSTITIPSCMGER